MTFAMELSGRHDKLERGLAAYLRAVEVEYRQNNFKSNKVISSKSYGGCDRNLRIILLGDSGVGKTAIANRFTSGEYKQNTRPTIGMDYCVRTMQQNGKILKIQLWDATGQESMRCILPAYFRNVEAIVLVYDCSNRTTFENLRVWLDLAQKHGDPLAQMFVVATKTDLEDKRQVTFQDALDFVIAKDLNFYEMSALTGLGLESAFSTIVSIVEKNCCQMSRKTITLRGKEGKKKGFCLCG